MTCEYCGREFVRPHNRGPAPLFCSASCRQGSHVKRLRERAYDGLASYSDDELFDEVVRRMEADFPSWSRRVLEMANDALLSIARPR